MGASEVEGAGEVHASRGPVAAVICSRGIRSTARRRHNDGRTAARGADVLAAGGDSPARRRPTRRTHGPTPGRRLSALDDALVVDPQ